jgi:hypothetical protein
VVRLNKKNNLFSCWIFNFVTIFAALIIIELKSFFFKPKKKERRRPYLRICQLLCPQQAQLDPLISLDHQKNGLEAGVGLS